MRAHRGSGGDAKTADRPRDDVLQLEIVAAVRKHVLDHVLGRGFALPGQLGGDLAGERHRLGLVLAVVEAHRGGGAGSVYVDGDLPVELDGEVLRLLDEDGDCSSLLVLRDGVLDRYMLVDEESMVDEALELA